MENFFFLNFKPDQDAIAQADLKGLYALPSQSFNEVDGLFG